MESTINPFPAGDKQQVRKAIYIRFNPYGVIVIMQIHGLQYLMPYGQRKMNYKDNWQGMIL